MNVLVITCNVSFLEKNFNFLVSYMYAFNDAIDRPPLWNYLSLNTTLPWCILGDFNCVTSLDEISGGREHWTPDMQVFKDCLTTAGLGHVRTIGNIFTWTNKRLLSPVSKRLDRMVTNANWFSKFSEGSAFVKAKGLMDHNPIVYVEPMQLQKFGKPFQFFSFMVDIPGFHDVIVRAWSLPCSDSPMGKFNAKLKQAKLLLRALNKEHGHVSTMLV